MKKNLILGVALLALAGGIVSCGSNPDDTILVDDAHTWVTHGNFLLSDGETANSWNGKSNELYEKSTMKAVSLTEIKGISEGVYNALKTKDVKALYTVDVVLGVNDAGWSSNCLKDGKLYKANGSYCIKAAQCSVNYEPDENDPEKKVAVYAEDQWIPDPKTAHGESLTADTLFLPVWQEAADENGFSWSSNPVCIGGAGKYTFVAAQYNTVSSASEAGFGLGLVKVEGMNSDYGAYEEITKWVAADHTYGVIGVAGDWNNDVAMTPNADKTEWSATVSLTAGNEFKVRADGKWDDSWGDNGYNGGNLKVEEAGDYVVTIGGFGVDRSATVAVKKA